MRRPPDPGERHLSPAAMRQSLQSLREVSDLSGNTKNISEPRLPGFAYPLVGRVRRVLAEDTHAPEPGQLCSPTV